MRSTLLSPDGHIVREEPRTRAQTNVAAYVTVWPSSTRRCFTCIAVVRAIATARSSNLTFCYYFAVGRVRKRCMWQSIIVIASDIAAVGSGTAIEIIASALAPGALATFRLHTS